MRLRRSPSRRSQARTDPALVLAAAALAAATLMVLGGCSLGEQKPESTPPTRSTDTPDEGRLGAAITVKGEDTELRVRAIRVIDPVSAGPVDRPLTPRARFVGVMLELENIGDGVYSASPLADSRLITSDGRRADPVTLAGGPCSRRFASHVTLRPSATAKGCVSFEVPAGGSPVTFEFALDSGFAPEVGTWRLG